MILLMFYISKGQLLMIHQGIILRGSSLPGEPTFSPGSDFQIFIVGLNFVCTGRSFDMFGWLVTRIFVCVLACYCYGSCCKEKSFSVFPSGGHDERTS